MSLLLASVAAGSSKASFDALANQIYADIPTAYWPLSDTGSVITDKSANALNGNTISGITTGLAALPAASKNKAYDFNGALNSGAGGKVNYNALLAPTTAVTLECWAKFDNFSRQQMILSKAQVGGYFFDIDGTGTLLRFGVRRNGAYFYAQVLTSTLSLGTLYHIVGTYDQRYSRLYLNGAEVAVNDGTVNFPIQFSVNNCFAFGADPDAGNTLAPGNELDGQLDECAVYSKVLSAERIKAHYKTGMNTVLSTEDPYWELTACLLHCEGTAGSTTFTDQKGKTVTANGNAQISTTQFYGGAASGILDGVGDWLSFATSTDFDPVPGDFTMEGFFYLNSSTGTPYLFQVGSAVTNRLAVRLTAGALEMVIQGASGTTTVNSGAEVSTGVWHHVAVVKRGATYVLYLDGSSVGVGSRALTVGSKSCAVGFEEFGGGATEYLSGYVDEFRVTRAARYGGRFIPATSAFPDIPVA